MKYLAGLRVTEAQHRRLAALCANNIDFPQTFEEWEAMLRLGEREAESSGTPVRPIEIEVEHFARWCSLVGIVPCIDALKAYVIVLRLGPNNGAPPVGRFQDRGQ